MDGVVGFEHVDHLAAIEGVEEAGWQAASGGPRGIDGDVTVAGFNGVPSCRRHCFVGRVEGRGETDGAVEVGDKAQPSWTEMSACSSAGLSVLGKGGLGERRGMRER